jgi:IS5 family transposase
VCKNIRISRSKILKGKEYRGYTASKREYFFGLKIHVLTASDGSIVEFEFTPGSWSDLRGLGQLPLDLPGGAELFLDKAYNDYSLEEIVREAAGVELRPVRKKNCKLADYTFEENRRRQDRRRPVESHLSRLNGMFPKRLHATSPQGLMLKLLGMVVAYNLLIFVKAL